MLVLQEDIMKEKRPCAIYYRKGYGGLLCMQMLEIIVTVVMFAKEQESHPEEMKCR